MKPYCLLQKEAWLNILRQLHKISYRHFNIDLVISGKKGNYLLQGINQFNLL